MNPHRKLLVLGLNELLGQRLVSLDREGADQGHVFANIGGAPSVVSWVEIGHDELRLSVWWKYDHGRHPQANLSGREREEFHTSYPLAKPQRFPEFVGVTVSGWLERRTGKHLQGYDADGLFDKYTRRGELAHLNALPVPKAKGYLTEGPVH